MQKEKKRDALDEIVDSAKGGTDKDYVIISWPVIGALQSIQFIPRSFTIYLAKLQVYRSIFACEIIQS